MGEREHIEALRVWAYARLKTEISTSEQVHLMSCPECLQTFKLCVECESAEEVKRRLEAS